MAISCGPAPKSTKPLSSRWGLYYHYLITGDASFVTNYYQLALQTAYASYYDSTNDSNAHYDFANNLMYGENVWEDSLMSFCTPTLPSYADCAMPPISPP